MKLFICHVFILLFFTGHSAKCQNEFRKIRMAISKSLLEEQTITVLDKSVYSSFNELLPSGTWPDIDYTNNMRAGWIPGKHLMRTQVLAKGFTNKDSQHYNSNSIYKAIVSALQSWHQKDCKSSNWWHNQIAAPQALGEIMILMKEGPKNLPKALVDSLLVRMNHGDMYKQTGANKMDVALHNIYRASLTENSGLMDSAVQEAFQPVSFTTDEGLQYDYSYLQHGKQMMISSYGFVFVNGGYKIASYLHNTSYAIHPEKLKILSAYFYNVFLKAIRGSYIDFNTEGRGISRPDILDKRIILEKRSLNNLFNLAIMLDKKNKDQIEAARSRLMQLKSPSYKVNPSHTYFWKADYDLHIRPEYSFNVRTVSNRTLRTETGNDENLLGNFLPDGATSILRRGNEYNNIQPLWEWSKIPGVTNRNYETDLGTKITKDWGLPGTNTFAGGASDSLYGVTAYQLDFDSVKAKKAWFFFDKEVVCLGADISSTAPEAIITTLNQCWLNGQVLSSNLTTPLQKNSVSTLPSPKWVWHDNIGYFFPAGGMVTISNQMQQGSWYRINKNQSKAEVSGEVFKLWLNHKIKPADSSYAYIVVPGLNSKKEISDYDEHNVSIVSNSSKIQAVLNNNLGMLQAVFYQPGILKTPLLTISVDAPCIVYLKNISSKNSTLYIADPIQQAHLITVTIQSNQGNDQILKCKMPLDNYAGSTAQYHFNL